MATQEDVAKLAGVSFITVSRVINNKDNVKEETKERVLKAIKELNYYPNSLGRALNNNRVFSIGILGPLAGNNSLEADSYHAKLIQGVEEACYDAKYDLLISTRRTSDPEFSYFRLFHQRKVDALIFMGANFEEQHIEEIIQYKIPCCVISDNPGSSHVGYIDTDNRSGMAQATERLIQLGHKRIAFLGVSARNFNIEERYAGFLQTMRNHNIPFRDEYYLQGGYTEQSGGEAIQAILAMKEKPTALVCGTDPMAYGALREAKKQNIKVPEQLSILGFDGYEFGRLLIPALATVSQPLIKMGYRAAELVIEKITNPDFVFEPIIFPVSQVEGGSIGKHTESL